MKFPYKASLTCMMAVALACGAAGAPAAAELPFSINADEAVGALQDCAALWGHGWIKPADAARPDSGHWIGAAPVSRHGWTPVGFRFVPAASGHARLNLNATPASGAAGRFEIRDLIADGITIKTNLHQQTIALTAGVPALIRFAARLAADSHADEMPRLPPVGTRAHDAIRFFQRGVNLGNRLEAPPDADWGATYAAADFDAIKAEGFDHVRIPCAWHHHQGAGPEFAINPDFFGQVDAMVAPAAARGMAVIINWHHFDAFTANPDAHRRQFIRGWEQIAAYYGKNTKIPGRIAFEPLNEPHAAATTAHMNNIYQTLIAIIREQAPDNTLFIAPGKWNHASELGNLRLPAAESNIIVTIHDYDPFLFTHQGAAWTAPLTATTNIGFPGPPAAPLTPDPALPQDAQNAWAIRWFTGYNTLPAEWNPCGITAIGINLRLARAWSDYYGRPIHVGEWGCIARAPTDARARYYAVKRRLLNENKLAWAIWDWKSHFRYWNPESNAPMPGMRPPFIFRRKSPANGCKYR